MSSRKFREDGEVDDESTLFSRTLSSSRSPIRNSPSSFSSKDRTEHEQRRMYGAGIASGVIGLLLGGPVVAIVAGLGAAYATDQPGPAGATARALGEAALVAQELDRKHHLVSKAKDVAVDTCRVVAHYVHEKRLIEHGIDAVGRVTYWVAEQLTEQVLAQQKHRRLEDD